MTYDIALMVKDQYVSVQASGPSSLISYMDLCHRLIQACEDSGRRSILVDIREISETPRIIDFYQLAKEASPLTQDKITKFALVRKKDGDEESFIEVVMRHRGMNIKSFHNDKEALSWLLNGET
ncbi:MAG: hypothetical protein KAH57_10005 [Thermoplasmata archaeon]|nr:hypothetical protein [Thermoplasmata archaeon]